jgi:hypothetical protein
MVAIVELASLPPHIRGAAVDAAIAGSQAEVLETGKRATSFSVGAGTPEVAKDFIELHGGIAGGQDFFKLPKDVFATNMTTLGAYMKANGITQITITAIRNALRDGEIKSHSLVVGATAAGPR